MGNRLPGRARSGKGMRRKIKFILLLIISGLALGAVTFMFSPFFHITDITVLGTETISHNHILERAMADGENIFLFNTRQAQERILGNLYIDSVQFDKDLPRSLTVTIRERRLSAYVEYMQGMFLYIDEVGRVLEVNPFFTKQCPVVTGLRFNRFNLGEILEVEDQAVFRHVVQYAQLIYQYNLADWISHLDVSDRFNIKIMVNHVEFNVGDGRNGEEKIRNIIAMMEVMPNPETIRGFVDMREVQDQYVFKILT
jgi:PAS domain-containing protein